MLCIYRSKANFAENMANNVKKRVKVPASTHPMWRNSEKRNFWDMRRKFWESTSVVILWKITGE